MNLKIKIKGREYDVELQEDKDKVIVKIDGKEYVFANNGEKSQIEKEDNPNETSAKILAKNNNIKEVKAPLSGTISEIFIKPGDEIKITQKLLTLSAMKMENEILAESNGKIKEILITKDQKVKENEILIILE